LDHQANVHIVAVCHPLGRAAALYLNGCLAASRSNITVQLSSVSDVVNYIGRSLYSADAYLQGSVDEFRIYDGVLTADRIAVNYALGPNQLYRDPGALRSVHLRVNATMDLESFQQVDLMGNFTDATNVPVCGFGTPEYLSLNRRVLTVDANGRVEAVGLGTATVMGRFGAFTANQSVTVVRSPVTLRHRYSFSEFAGSSTAADSVGGAHGAVTGGATFNEAGQLTLDGVSGFVELPNGIISVLTNATFEAWITWTSTRTWERIFDFGNSTLGEGGQGEGTSYLFASPQGGAGRLRFGQRVNLLETPILDGPTALPQGVLSHVAVSFNGTGQRVRLYYNGQLVAEGPPVHSLQQMDDVNNWLGKSQFVADAYFAGSYDEFRIYDGVLTAADVAASFAVGPDDLAGASLQITRDTSGKVVISWPTTAAGYQLQASPVLGPEADWLPVSEAPVREDGMLRLTLTPTGATRFFRLLK
jgi:hypothetical protein